MQGEPVVDGYLLLGDASIYTNAFFGQGIALGLWQAQQLANLSDRIEAAGDGLVAEMEAWTDRTLGPRFAFQAEIDARRTATWLDGIRGAPAPEPVGEHRRMAAVFALGADGDEGAASEGARIMHLLGGLEEELAEPDLARRLADFLDTSPQLGAGPGELPRQEFEALVG